VTEGEHTASDWRISRLEHRVHELQSAMVVLVRQLGFEENVAAAERSRLDMIRIRGEVPRERLLELLSTPPKQR